MKNFNSISNRFHFTCLESHVELLKNVYPCGYIRLVGSVLNLFNVVRSSEEVRVIGSNEYGKGQLSGEGVSVGRKTENCGI